VPEHGVLLHKIDLFFIDRNTGSEWAILTQAPDTKWNSVAAAYELVRQTFQPNG